MPHRNKTTKEGAVKLKVGVLGSGVVGETLANGFIKFGYEVMRASRDPSKLAGWKAKAGATASTGNFEQAVKFGDLIVLAIKGSAAQSAIKQAGIGFLNGKTIIDTTNPISEEPPSNGVLKFFSDINGSLMEKLQRLAPDAHFVKAFSCVGHGLMVEPKLAGGVQPTMFICGNDAGAKRKVTEVLTQFGWETYDMGKAEAARAIEPLCMLWCIPGLTKNQWGHAFKLLKV